MGKASSIFQTFVEDRGPHKLNTTPSEAHVEAHLLNYMSERGVPINMTRGRTDKELEKELSYG